MNFQISGYYIEITNCCNAKCFFCYNNSGYEKHNALDISIIEKIIKEDDNISNKEIVLSGGEPFLHKDIMKIIRLVITKNIKCKIITNGTSLNIATLNQLRGLPITLQLSLNGMSAETHDAITDLPGSYEAICSAIKYIKANMPYIRLQIRFLIQKTNINELKDIKTSFLYQLADDIILDILKFTGREPQDYDCFFSPSEILQTYYRIEKMKKELSKISIPKITSICKFCESNRNIHVFPKVDCFGNVYPCNLFCGSKYQIGNVVGESIAQLLKNNAMNSFLDKCNSRKHFIESCTKCFANEVCYGGCPGLSDISGDYYHEDIYCTLRKEYFLNKLKSVLI